jgi:hypothetical protein
MRARYAAAFLYLAWSSAALAHDVRPAYLEIFESADLSVEVYWKQPVAGEVGLPLVPRLSSGWLSAQPIDVEHTQSYLAKRWRIAAPHVPLAHQRVRIEGLDRTLTDVLLRVRYASGEELSQLIKPTTPEFELPSLGKRVLPTAQYVQLGFTHIWGGIDHLLFVLGLVLLVPQWRTLLKTITAFTLAHSMTLAAAALGFVNAPAAPIEAVIALSIVYVAVELVRVQRGESSLTQRSPWLIAFAFGLLHGFGFAGALTEIGLPPDAIAPALLLFNVGIEVGQLTFVLALFALAYMAARAPVGVQARLRVMRAVPYAIGSLAAVWFFERSAAALQLT